MKGLLAILLLAVVEGSGYTGTGGSYDDGDGTDGGSPPGTGGGGLDDDDDNGYGGGLDDDDDNGYGAGSNDFSAGGSPPGADGAGSEDHSTGGSPPGAGGGGDAGCPTECGGASGNCSTSCGAIGPCGASGQFLSGESCRLCMESHGCTPCWHCLSDAAKHAPLAPAPAPPDEPWLLSSPRQTPPSFQPSAITALFDGENRTYTMQIASFSRSPTKDKWDDPDFTGRIILTEDLGDVLGVKITNHSNWHVGLDCSSVQGAILVSRRGAEYGTKARAAEAVGAGAVITIGDDSSDFKMRTPLAAGTAATIPSYYMPAHVATQLLGECQDEETLPYCRKWAEAGQCRLNPRYMNRMCKRSCGQCTAAEIASCSDCAAKEARGPEGRCSCRAPSKPVRLETAFMSSPSDRGVLQDIYNSMTNKEQWQFGLLGTHFDGTPWQNMSALSPGVASWSSAILDDNDPCGAQRGPTGQSQRLWGVTCSGSGNVVSIDLSFGVNNARNSWSVPASIGQLNKLRFLAMPGLGGVGSLPSSMYSLGHLAVLRLEHNHFSGELPAISEHPPGHAMHGSSLVYADLSGNNVTDLAKGSFHPNLVTLMGLTAPTHVGGGATPSLLVASKSANIFLRYSGVENSTLPVTDAGARAMNLDGAQAHVHIACPSSWQPNEFPHGYDPRGSGAADGSSFGSGGDSGGAHHDHGADGTGGGGDFRDSGAADGSSYGSGGGSGGAHHDHGAGGTGGGGDLHDSGAAVGSNYGSDSGSGGAHHDHGAGGTVAGGSDPGNYDGSDATAGDGAAGGDGSDDYGSGDGSPPGDGGGSDGHGAGGSGPS